METLINRTDVEVVISPISPTTIIGERINPAGKEWLKEALRNGELEQLGALAKEQVEAGANIIDVNVTVPGVDEVDLLSRAVQGVQKAVKVPLSIDSSRKPCRGKKYLRWHH